MNRIAGLSIIVGMFVLMYVAIALTSTVFVASLVYLISFTAAAILIMGISLAAGEDAFAAFRDLLDR